ncbi:MAG: endonuclease/exonuclease/phosphatase family protein [Acidobacteriota bacterium]
MYRKACVVLLAGVLCAACFPPFVRTDYTIRLLVFNIHAGKSATGTDNIAGIADLIRTTKADAVLLQEVDRGTNRSGKVDQVQVLIDRTKYAAAFGRSLDFDGGQYGIAILSRRPINFNQTFPLPVDPAQARSGGSHEPRSALLASLETLRGRLQIMTTHLDSSNQDIYRLQEVPGLLNVVRPRRSDYTPVVLGGDFNAEPTSAVIQKLRDAGLRDAWIECGQGDGFTYPADHPAKRIDYVFITNPLRCTSAQVIDTQISDHRPLLVTLSDPGPGM